jgi:hypothetical protein
MQLGKLFAKFHFQAQKYSLLYAVKFFPLNLLQKQIASQDSYSSNHQEKIPFI